MCVCLFTYRL
uniref:Uncharacterized protein n=1 Tax=Anguilla anguilla TaxID=7936 RepID=A0A0E9PZU5_ANGAN